MSSTARRNRAGIVRFTCLGIVRQPSRSPGGVPASASITTTVNPAPPAPPVASFLASPTLGTAPLTVAFTDTSTGTVTSRSWTFGDQSGSNAQNPTHTYNTSGLYTVTLTVTGPGGSSSSSKQILVE